MKLKTIETEGVPRLQIETPVGPSTACRATQSTLEPDGRTCPRCSSFDTRAARSTGLLARLAQLFGLRPLRCRNCRKRFFRRPQDSATVVSPLNDERTDRDYFVG